MGAAPIRPLIYQHRLLRLRWRCWGKPTLAGLPAGVSPAACGPRLEAHVATLAGVFCLWRCQRAQVLREIFGSEISVGAVDATLMRMSAVLADPWQALREAVREAAVVHGDETGWRLAGAQQVAVARAERPRRLLPDRPSPQPGGGQGAPWGGLRRLRHLRPLRRLPLPRHPPTATLLESRDQADGRDLRAPGPAPPAGSAQSP